MAKVRIGIDVGGTFTDALAIDSETMEIIGQAKVKTTHNEQEGVAAGIVAVLKKLLSENNIAPEDVIFIAHGTTQATNALLEGDVAKVGILSIGAGAMSKQIDHLSDIGSLELSPGRFLEVEHSCIQGDKKNTNRDILECLNELKDRGAEVIVASEAFSVDNPRNEDKIVELAKKAGLQATSTHEVSNLYGLRIRTRTAAVNASLIPKMLDTARMTSSCVEKSSIKAPLMIMRCDGGVMTVGEMETRPILTLLSGLAAGVAGALMYEKVSNGIFLEAGGTSTDISAIKDGKVMLRSPEVGQHKLYLSALDVATRGVAGGSMIRVEKGKIAGVGPRSAHIASLPYECFEDPLEEPKVKMIAPCAKDKADYAIVEDKNGRSAALTLAGAANLLGYVMEDDYAFGDKKAAQIAWQALGDSLGLSATEAAKQALDKAVETLKNVIDVLIEEYKLNKRTLELVGGGGSAGVITPYLAEALGYRYRIAKNAPLISAIGVAMAMVREVVERTVINPGEADIRSIRKEATEALLKAGALLETIEIFIEIDKKKNILRAIAVGTQDTRNKTILQDITEDELAKKAAEAMNTEKDRVVKAASVGRFSMYSSKREDRSFFKKKAIYDVCMIDKDGVVNLVRESRGALVCTKGELEEKIDFMIHELTLYDVVGGILPFIYVFFGEKQIDLTGVGEKEQLMAILQMELSDYEDDENMIILAVK